jgi:hypothetical protein
LLESIVEVFLMQTPQAISKGDVLQRAGSIGLVVGGSATLVGNAMFPRTDDPGDVNARLAALGGDETTTLIAGPTILVGFWALLVGTMGIYRSITSANAAPWARMGFYGVIMATAVSSVTMGTLVGANDITPPTGWPRGARRGRQGMPSWQP